MQWVRRAAALGFVALLLPACGLMGGPPRSVSPSFGPPLHAGLTGSQVVPAVATPATGTATITVDSNRQFIDYMINATGIATAVTAIEIRLAEPGANGAVVFSIPIGTFPLSGRLTEADFIMAKPVFFFSAAVDAILSGTAYLIISSNAFPTGEVRGHIGTADLASAILSGSQESTPVGSAGTGVALVMLNDAQDGFTVSLTVSGLAGIQGAQIFDGKPGVDGSNALFTISSTSFTTTASATLGAGDFTASATVTTFADAITALLSGGLYIQVPTIAHSTGELRGQIGPTQLNAPLTPGAVVPPVVSAASGSATVALSARQDEFFITMTHTVVSPQAVEIHVQQPTANGPLIFNVSAIAGAATSPLATTVMPNRLIQAPGEVIDTFQDAINAMLTKRTYVIVTSPGFPVAGEIRGQFVP
jgi:hypothetical protein